MELERDALDEQSTRAANLTALEEHRREVRSKLRVVANSLRDAGAVASGYDTSYFLEPPPPDFPAATVHGRLFRCRRVPLSSAQQARDKARSFDFDPPDSERIEWSLSALGREKCEVVFARFDADADGAWSYSEFLEYLAALEQAHARPDIRAFADHPEVWQMYMSDLYDTDAYGRLSLAGFMLYREAIEAATPLECDLRVLHIPVEWSALARTRQLSQLFDAYADPDGSVALPAAHYLFADCGYVMPFAELCETLVRQRQLARCLKSVLSRKRSLRLFGYRQKSALVFTNPQLDAEPMICKPAFWSLVLSSWTPASTTRWRHWLRQCHLTLFTTLRRWQRAATWAFAHTRDVARTGLLRASCLMSEPLRERGDYVVKLDVGSRFTSHATVHVTYNSDADSAATLHELKYLERGAECFVYIDLTCRSGTKENDVQWLSQRLSWFLHEYFRDHLGSLPCFHKWFVTVPTKLQLRSGPSTSGSGATAASSSAPVIRVVVLFTGAADLYHVMQRLGLPSSMQFDHLLQRLSLRVLASHSLEDLLTSKRLDVGAQWACRAQLDARLNRQAWAQILAQLAERLAVESAAEADEAAYLAAERQLKQREAEQQQSPSKRSGSDEPAAPRGTRIDDSEQQFAGAREPHRLDSIRSRLETLARVLGGSHEVSACVSFPSLSDAVLGNRWLASALSPALFKRIKHIVTTPGSFASEWKSGCDAFRAEFHATQSSSSSSTGSRPMLSRASSRSSAPGADDLEHSIAASFPFATPVSTSEAHVRPLASAAMSTAAPTLTSRYELGTARSGVDPKDATGEPKRDDSAEGELLELYDMCAKHLLGVSVVRAEAGTSGLTCVFEGWNVFSLLPRVHSQQARRRASVVRTKSSSSTASATGVAPAAPAGVAGPSRGR